MRTSLLGVRPIVISRLSNDVVVGGSPDFEIVIRNMRCARMFARLRRLGKGSRKKLVENDGVDFTVVSRRRGHAGEAHVGWHWQVHRPAADTCP